VVGSKFAWYLPLYRQVQIPVAWWLKSFYKLQLRTIQASARVFCDEKPMPVFDPGRGCTRTCQFWAHAMDDRR